MPTAEDSLGLLGGSYMVIWLAAAETASTSPLFDSSRSAAIWCDMSMDELSLIACIFV